MKQYKNLDSVIESNHRFKNETGIKSLLKKEVFRNFRMFSKLSKILIITIIAMFTVGLVNAQIKQKTKRVQQNETISDSEIRRLIPNLDALRVVQVDSKFGVIRAKPRPLEGEYIIEPIFNKEPIIYGSNPGNTYIKIINTDGYSNLYDKFGFVVAQGHEILPIYIQNSKEVAAFIIRWDFGEPSYSLYECPEKYELIQQGDLLSGNLRLIPYTEKRIQNCRSITLTEDNQLKCVKSDGSIEFIPIRRQSV